MTNFKQVSNYLHSSMLNSITQEGGHLLWQPKTKFKSTLILRLESVRN